MPNHLIYETSPYLLQHAENPVDWYPWGPEALQKARREDKPIFLSIGYAACHWCHVMAHESFEDPAIAALINQSYVPIKVDREERPDLDNLYMDAVIAMTGQGGWPMSVFLTPEYVPFYGGTYFPAVARQGMPAFRDVLLQLAEIWQHDRTRIVEAGREVAAQLQGSTRWEAGHQALTPSLLKEAGQTMTLSYDWEHGGWGTAPKFPQPMSVEFLLRLATRGDAAALQVANHALASMARGGMYDVVGGGFHRYSTDADWLVPHFEKMLYDNAQLALAYLHGYLLGGSPLFERICEETLDFILREMTGAAGGFFSSLDADSEGREGKYYLWTREEITQALDNAPDLEFLAAAYDLRPEGNFDGAIILQRTSGDTELGEKFGLPVEEVPKRLRRLHLRLRETREGRIRPACDDKVLVAWNCLAIQALAQAARYLERPDYLAAAERSADFLLTHLHTNERLQRTWRSGQARNNAALDDCAGLMIALLDLYQSSPQPRWYQSAVRLAEEMLAHYRDPDGGFFDARDDQTDLLARPKNVQDNATPCGNAQAAYALLQLSAYSERSDWQELAEGMLKSAQKAAVRYPTAFSYWLCAIDLAVGPLQQVAILSPEEHPDLQLMLRALWATYRPRLVAALATQPMPAGAPSLLEDRQALDGKPTAYVCQGFVCQRPVTTAAEMAAQLKGPALV